jgi:hypothetical protein
MDGVARVMRDQAGVISRRQALELGMTVTQVKRAVRRREWIQVHPGVYVDHNGELTWLQRAWAAVLFSWPAALTLDSALRAHEGPGRAGRDQDVIHVAVARGRKINVPDGVRVHHVPDLDSVALWNLGPPRLRYEQSVLHVASSARSDLAAIATLADACGARRTTAVRLLEALAGLPRLPRRRWIAGILQDVAEGTCSVLEHGYLTRVERAHGLPRGTRQHPELASGRPMFRDVLHAEHGLVVELDGRLFHGSSEAWDRDLERDLDAAVARTEETVRLGYGQVFERPCSTAVKVARVLQRRGWTGEPRKCATCSSSGQPG